MVRVIVAITCFLVDVLRERSMIACTRSDAIPTFVFTRSEPIPMSWVDGSKKRALFLSSDDHSRSEWEERGEKGDFFVYI